MAASTSIKQRNGTAVSFTDTTVTSQRFCLADATADGTVHPITTPASGTVYSFVATTALWADTAPATGINNVRYYTSGTNPWTGVTMQIGFSSTYTQATGTSLTGVQLTTSNFPGTSTPVDAFSLTSSAPLVVGGSISAAAGKISNFLEGQMTVSATALQGPLTATNGYWLYDES